MSGAASSRPRLSVVPAGCEEGEPVGPRWEAVYREHIAAVYGYVYARTGNRPDAEDVTSDVFLRALPRLLEGAPPGQVRAYLMATARTALADFWARAYSSPVAGLDDGSAVRAGAALGGSGREESAGGEAAAVGRLLDRLPERHRAVLELRFLRGYSIKETAAALGLSVANAKVVQWRALRRAAALREGLSR